MINQFSLFPSYLKEQQAERAKKKRLRVKELMKAGLLESFEKDWIKRFAEVEYILKQMQLKDTSTDVFMRGQLIKPEDLLGSQQEWMRVYNLYMGMEKNFYKPYWVPFIRGSYDFFFDLSDKKIPVIKTTFYFVEPMQYMKAVLFNKAVHLIKPEDDDLNWVRWLDEMTRKQREISAQRPELVYAGKYEVVPPLAYEIFYESELEEGAEKGVLRRKKNEIKCTVVSSLITSLLPYDLAVTIEEIKFEGQEYLIPDKVKCVRDMVFFIRCCEEGFQDGTRVQRYKINFTDAGKSYMVFKNGAFILHHEDKTILDGFEKKYREYYVRERNAEEAIMHPCD